MNIRRDEARINAIYLQQQLNDFRDQDRPIPKWTKLDREAVSQILHEYRYLNLCYRLAVDKLQDHDLQADMPENWVPEEFDASWFIEPQTVQNGGLFFKIRRIFGKST